MEDDLSKQQELLHEHAQSLLRKKLMNHYLGICDCDHKDGTYGLCYAGQWLNKEITDKEVITDMTAITTKHSDS